MKKIGPTWNSAPTRRAIQAAFTRRAGIAARILVMTGFLPCEWEALAAFDLTPAVHSLADIADLDRMARAADRTVEYHLKIDSGMGRLGSRSPAATISLMPFVALT